MFIERAFCLSVMRARDESKSVKVETCTTLMLLVHPYTEETEEGSTKLIACVNLILANYQTNKGLHDTTDAAFYNFRGNSTAHHE